MDSILALLIGAAVSCLVYFLAKILIGSPARDQKSVKPPQTDDDHTAPIPVAAPASLPAASPSEAAAAVPVVQQGSRSWQPTPVATIPKCVAFFDVETTGLSE